MHTDAYCNDCFPNRQVGRFREIPPALYVSYRYTFVKGEVSALINLARTLGGFSVAYFQVPWATKHGALQVFGVEAAIVSGLFLLVVPVLQLKGLHLRVSVVFI